MENREFASYGYKIDNSMGILIGAAIVSIFLAFMCSAAISKWFLLLLLSPVGVFVYIRQSGCDKPLLIASRYLILGDRILYYSNISHARLDKAKQTLTLSTEKGKNLTISADKFPTNARKAEKIRINKTAKFEKVTERIITRLRATSPDIVIN